MSEMVRGGRRKDMRWRSWCTLVEGYSVYGAESEARTAQELRIPPRSLGVSVWYRLMLRQAG